MDPAHADIIEKTPPTCRLVHSVYEFQFKGPTLDERILIVCFCSYLQNLQN